MKTALACGLPQRTGRDVPHPCAQPLSCSFLVQPGVNTVAVLFAPILDASEDLHIDSILSSANPGLGSPLSILRALLGESGLELFVVWGTSGRPQ